MKHHPQRGYVGAWERLPSDRALCDVHVFCSAVCVTPFTSPWWGEVRWGLLSVCQAQTDTSVDVFIAYPSYHECKLASSNMKVPLWWYSTNVYQQERVPWTPSKIKTKVKMFCNASAETYWCIGSFWSLLLFHGFFSICPSCLAERLASWLGLKPEFYFFFFFCIWTLKRHKSCARKEIIFLREAPDL